MKSYTTKKTEVFLKNKWGIKQLGEEGFEKIFLTSFGTGIIFNALSFNLDFRALKTFITEI